MGDLSVIEISGLVVFALIALTFFIVSANNKDKAKDAKALKEIKEATLGSTGQAKSAKKKSAKKATGKKKTAKKKSAKKKAGKKKVNKSTPKKKK